MSRVTPAFAEDAVLGGLLLANDRLHDVAPLLSAEHFTSPKRARLYSIIRDRVLAGEPADAVTVGEVDAGLFDDAVDLARNTPGGVVSAWGSALSSAPFGR